MKNTRLLFVAIVFANIILTHTLQAASFDCAKKSTLIENVICSDQNISNLDEVLSSTYKKALNSAVDGTKIKLEQRTWLKEVRNKCQTSQCLEQAYQQRIKSLVVKPNTDRQQDIVMGRCHMNTCWWWKVEKTETIQSGNKGRLIRVLTKTATLEYPDGNYPDVFPASKNNMWSKDKEESYVFCSSHVPAFIEYDAHARQYTGTIPFDQDGVSSGATEGIANLYLHICNGGQQPGFAIRSEVLEKEIILYDPKDIFQY
ncbi:MAG: lysozyme inhibitor LprI family protein [Methylococcaceae bacterium]